MEIANGKYRARAIRGDFGFTQGGKEQVVVEFDLLDDDYQGRKINWFGYFTDKTTDRTLDSLRHCGWDGVDLQVLTGLGSTEVELIIERKEYNGKERTKVQWVNRLGSGFQQKAPMGADQAKAFAEKMKGKIIAHGQQYKAGGTTTKDPF